MKTKFVALLASLFVLASCGTGTSIVFGPDGIRVVAPEQVIDVPTKPLIVNETK